VAFGPVASTQAGWAVEHAKNHAPSVSAGEVTIKGDSRVYLMQDHTATAWQDHKYVRFDLHSEPLDLTVDLSNVPCGCLACVYLVAPEDPDITGSNYCDMAENVRPGYGGGTCTEIDLFEANNNAMQTAIHTQLGGTYGSGNCDRNGCFARVGGPQSPGPYQNSWGQHKTIDSTRPFNLNAAVDTQGALEINLRQGSSHVTSFNRQMAGNPQGHGVPGSALSATRAAQGHLALVASLWSAPDLSWLDGPGCNQCNLATASMKITVNSQVDAAAASAASASRSRTSAAEPSCDESACTSAGNDCCAPGTQARTCSGGLEPVDVPGECFGHSNARYTCCHAGASTIEASTGWTAPAPVSDDSFVIAGRRELEANATTATQTNATTAIQAYATTAAQSNAKVAGEKAAGKVAAERVGRATVEALSAAAAARTGEEDVTPKL